ncbi:DUF2793 domain-containing protein [Parvularcula lutaonensis]|uniref:DUF2793 domain-containing protein n=1 Tax=Parvularcula lutaonensis TaxID=491923 RepID=A0ABV7MA21_9PROT|nr:DUF2793 domain-containing protein [Parvularcula lutaonensis]GGY36668.1 hypothetical protein GCM10007148_01060 [Parvularcula lutaonensis]
MSLTSARLSLSYLAEAQAQKHVTVNESFRRLDALVHLSVKSVSIVAEPAASDGDAYILPAGATGTDWGGQPEGTLMVFQEGAWIAIAPASGMSAYTEDDGILRYFDGTGWKPVSEPSKLGVNASPDATNRLAVKSDAVLVSHDDVTPGSGDVRFVLNKSGSGNTATLVFQSGWAGKAEFGLAGTDDFSIKVADDGGTFRDAIVIDRQTGAVSFPNTP